MHFLEVAQQVKTLSGHKDYVCVRAVRDVRDVAIFQVVGSCDIDTDSSPNTKTSSRKLGVLMHSIPSCPTVLLQEMISKATGQVRKPKK